MADRKFYDGNRLLTTLDVNGKKPEIFISTSNRSAGKTTFFNKFCVDKFKNGEGKFGLIYRYNYELDDCADKFFKDIEGLFYPGEEMTSERRAQGIYHELFLNGISCGYALSLNSADQIKKNSHLFSDIERMLFDEFQSETNHYCSNEVKKFISIHTSIARGQGKQVRYLPVYMIGNHVSLINPYYVEMGICSRLKHETKILRGNGFVLEQGFNQNASDAIKASGFNAAFAGNAYIESSAGERVYLNDNQAFVDKPKGKGRYLATLKYNDRLYALREFAEAGVIYCDDKADVSFPLKITVTTEDHEINYIMLKRNSLFLSAMREYFEYGLFRFKDLRCKEAVLTALSY